MVEREKPFDKTKRQKNKKTVIYMIFIFVLLYTMCIKHFILSWYQMLHSSLCLNIALECWHFVTSNCTKRIKKNQHHFIHLDLSLLFIFALYFAVQDRFECCSLVLKKRMVKIVYKHL